MLNFLRDLAFPWWIYALAIACLAGQIAATAQAFRQWRGRSWLRAPAKPPSLWSAAAAAAIALAGLAAAVAFIEPARRATIALGIGPRSRELAYYHLNPSALDRYGLLAYVPAWILLSAVLLALALTFALSSRWKATVACAAAAAPPDGTRGEARVPSTGEVAVAVFSFLFCSVLPFLLGTLMVGWRMRAAGKMAAGAEPAEKVHILLNGVSAAIRALDLGAMVGIAGLVVALVIALLLMKRWQGQGLSWKRSGPYSGPLACALVLTAAGAIFWSARPLRLENQAPWPADLGDGMRVWPPVRADSVERLPTESHLQFQNRFSDNLELLRGPLIPGTREGTRTATLLRVLPDHFVVGGRRLSLADLREELQTGMNNHDLLHPGAQRRDIIAVWSAPEVSGRVFADGLRLACEVGYREADLVSFRRETIRRPTFGPLSRVHFTATPARLSCHPADGEVGGNELRLAPLDYSHFEDLLTAAVEATRSGRSVSIVLPERPRYQPGQE